MKQLQKNTSKETYFLLSIIAAAAAAAAEEGEELLLLAVEFSKDLASRCKAGLVSKLELTEATECKPDKWLLLGIILSKNLRLSFKKFWKKFKDYYDWAKRTSEDKKLHFWMAFT